MNKTKYIRLVIIASIALFGVIGTQAFIFYKSYSISQNLYHSHIQLSLHNLGEEISSENLFIKADSKSKITEIVYNNITKNNKIRDYKIGIIKIDNDSVIYSNTEDNTDKIQSYEFVDYQHYHDKNLNFLIYLDINEKYNGNIYSLLIWIIVSFILILIISFAFIFIIKISLMQKALSDTKNNFINNMSHELKTPVATITVASDMLSKKIVLEDVDKLKRYSEIIKNESIRLRNLIDRVLQIAIFDKKKPELKLETVNINKLLKEVAIPFELVIKEKNGNFTLNLKADESDYLIDRTHFVNVVSNLLDNAIKYSSENDLDISLSTQNKGRGIEVIVDDKGIGIPKSERSNVFEKFHRVNLSDRHDVKGFGVGLYYVNQIIKAMNAKIILIDNKERYGTRGSKFIIQINKKA